MRPTIEKKRVNITHLIFIVIIIICILAIGIAVYTQFFKDEKLGLIFGITDEEEDEEYKNLQENFLNIFDNSIKIIETYSGNVEKIKDEEEIVLLVENRQEQNDNYTLDIKIPYLNINTENAKKMNSEIKTIFKDKSESVLSSTGDDNIIYNVKYKAYEYNNLLSLVILSELKEGNNNERIILQTYNYDLEKNEQIKIDQILNIKEIEKSYANEKIKEEINYSQEENIKLSELGYNTNVRDSNSDIYKIENAEEFFIGENGYLYIIYAYGNNEFTSEMNVVILK